MKKKDSFDIAAAMSSLVKATAAERRWDELLGKETRAYRDVALYAVDRLLAAGAQLADVINYLRENASLEP